MKPVRLNIPRVGGYVYEAKGGFCLAFSTLGAWNAAQALPVGGLASGACSAQRRALDPLGRLFWLLGSAGRRMEKHGARARPNRLAQEDLA